MIAILKRTSILSVCLVLLAMISAAAPAQDEKPVKAKLGEKAPDFTLTDCNDQKRSLSDYKGKLVILEWIDHECHFVQRHYRAGSMKATYRKIKELDKSAVWLAVNSTPSTTARKNKIWIGQYNIEYPILLDPNRATARSYDARMTPHLFVIDKEGVLRYHGAIDDDGLGAKEKGQVTNYVINAVRQIINEETVLPDHVKPYGCRIKVRR